ncbi:RNA polymerase sigma factor [Cerasicoccus maritimus]|uniref:RNA polymerase sigma factor n=1 Tax=Cerasicoccus maritimus TaxID=490089 RepID=UPI0028525B24|nr:RNA polymerase sigma factor [Cerasicoccus maritimus]
MSDASATPDHDAEVDVDAERMLRVAQGDQQALREIIEHWQGPLINFFYRSLRSVEASEDLAQTVFIRIYRAADRYQPTAKFSTYLFHIARRILINEYRRQSRKPLDAVDPAELHASTPGTDKIRMMELEEAFAQAVENLPENQRSAILLLKQQQLSYEEIAKALDASESAVKSWIHRARQKLKEELADFYQPE